jgi:hypothetical protein
MKVRIFLMKRSILYSCFILTIMVLPACRKNIDADSWLVGQWMGEDRETYDIQVIDIKSDGTGSYKNGDYKKVRVNNKSIKIGSKEFDIVDPPGPVDSAEFRASDLYSYYPPTHAPPTLRMKLHLPVLWGNYDIVFYKWEH